MVEWVNGDQGKECKEIDIYIHLWVVHEFHPSLDHILALGITVCALMEYFECVTLAALTERGQAIHARSLTTVHRSAAAQTDVAVAGGAVGT